MHGVPQLPEAVVEVKDFRGKYWGKWGRGRVEVMGINRTNENGKVATARVHIVAIDRSVRKIGGRTFWDGAFHGCMNLVKVTAPFVEEVRELAFWEAYNLRHVTFSPNVAVTPTAFSGSLSPEVLAASVGFV